MSQAAHSVTINNAELATVREAMRELGRLLDQLDDGTLEKVVLTQRNQMRAVLISVERYAELEGPRGVTSAALASDLERKRPSSA
jgi:hypothetical protein